MSVKQLFFSILSYKIEIGIETFQFQDKKMMKHEQLVDVQKRIFDFFQAFTNLNENSKGYGLTIDHSEKTQVASIASTGFFLSSIIIGIKQGYISYEKGYKQVLGTLKTLYEHADHFHGFFAHFLNIEDATRYKKSEFSTIDTMLCVYGVLAVENYFDDKVKQLAQSIIDRIDWEYFVFQKEDKLYLHMAYNPDKDGDYVTEEAGFIYQWDMFAEQLGMYILIADKHPELARKLYHDFQRLDFTYNDLSYVGTPGNTLFVYQFPLCWLDLRDIYDDQGICWFENAKTATLAHQQFCIDYKNQFKTFSSSLFGLTACHSPKGYRVFHALPNTLNKVVSDGTISPCGPLGSYVLTPEISSQSLEEMLNIKGLYGKYGFYDAFNFDADKTWISNRYYGINQGLILLMINAHVSKDVYEQVMSHEMIMKGMANLSWIKK